jgi:hypothetical protein
MDASLFYPGRMGLSEREAFSICRDVISRVEEFGGALTINWHQRSLSPERNWDRFYMKLLGVLEEKGVWFASGRQAVQWYRKRRAIRFENVGEDTKSLRLSAGSVSGAGNRGTPGVMVRKYLPGMPASGGSGEGEEMFPRVDIEWTCDSDLEIPPDFQ